MMKILVILILLGLAYRYRGSIIKIIAAAAVVLLALRSFGMYLVAIVLTLGIWAGLFWFFNLVASGPNCDSEYEELFREWDKWYQRNHQCH